MPNQTVPPSLHVDFPDRSAKGLLAREHPKWAAVRIAILLARPEKG